MIALLIETLTALEDWTACSKALFQGGIIYMDISKLPKGTKYIIYFQEIKNFSITELWTIFQKQECVSQNQDSGLYAKKSGVLFF